MSTGSTADERKLLAGVLRKSLYDMAFLDIQRASDGCSKMGAFILASCLIDAMAGYVSGKTTSDGGSGEDYKCFVTHYLSQYNKDDLYINLRCGLVHSYTDYAKAANKNRTSQNGSKYFFTDLQNHPEVKDLHNQKSATGKTIVVLEDFVADVEIALKKLLSEIENDDGRYRAARARYESLGTMGMVAVEFVAPKPFSLRG